MLRQMRNFSGSSLMTGRVFWATGLYFFLAARNMGANLERSEGSEVGRESGEGIVGVLELDKLYKGEKRESGGVQADK